MALPAYTYESENFCFECVHDLEHCHGTAIVHLGESAECSDDPDCTIPPELHVFVVGCEDESCCGVAAA